MATSFSANAVIVITNFLKIADRKSGNDVTYSKNHIRFPY